MNVAGYVKLAKLWERSREEALKLQHKYYSELVSSYPDYHLVDVYVDITGSKEIRKRPEMIRLLRDCMEGKIDLIYSQTKGYLAANTRELCYLLKFVFSLDHPIDFVTEDGSYNINTIANEENQKKELFNMAEKYCKLNPSDYEKWKNTIMKLIKDGTEDE